MADSHLIKTTCQNEYVEVPPVMLVSGRYCWRNVKITTRHAGPGLNYLLFA